MYTGTVSSKANFAAYLERENILWPLTESGEHLNLRDATFRKQAELHPQLRPLRDLRHVMSVMRLYDYCNGEDGRNRVHLAPFCSVTGRNQPSNSRFIFGIDIGTCAACCGALRIIACIEDPAMIKKILAQLDNENACAEPSRLPPCRAPPQAHWF